MREMTRRLTKVERSLEDASSGESHLRVAALALRVMWTQARKEGCSEDVEEAESLYDRLRAGDFVDLAAILQAMPSTLQRRLDVIVKTVESFDNAHTGDQL